MSYTDLRALLQRLTIRTSFRWMLATLFCSMLVSPPYYGPAAHAQIGDAGSELDDSGGSGRSGRSSRSSTRGSSRSNSRSRGSGVDQANDRNSGPGSDTGSNRRRTSESQRDRERNSRPNGKATPTPAAGGKKLTTTKGKQPPSSSPKGSTGGEARAATNVEFKMQANPSTNLLYIEGLGLEPTLNIQAQEGKEFITRVSLQNPRGSSFQEFHVSLKYDPSVIRPVGIDDNNLLSMVEEEPTAQVDSRRGVITFAADLSTSRSDPVFNVFKVQWKALAPIGDSPIRFLNTSTHRTFVKSKDGENILHLRDDDGQVEASENAGLVDASVTVLPSSETARVLDEEEGSFSSIALAHNISEGTAEGGIVLELRPRKQYVRVGEEFLVDVLYSNPRRAELDTIQLLIRFNPEVLQVVDYDEENWITRGVNIHDGAYHEELPFDFHRRNVVHNDRGVIDYDMGFASRVRIPGKGTIATIRMRAIAPAASTQIVFVADERPEDAESEEPKTSVTFLGFNLIGTPGARAASMRDTALTVSAM